MHKIHSQRFEYTDFSIDHLNHESMAVMNVVLAGLNVARDNYLKSKDKEDWWQMIQLLPSSYNQKRTLMLNYEVLYNIYHSRKDHKLDEWREFCEWIKLLPLSKELILEVGNE